MYLLDDVEKGFKWARWDHKNNNNPTKWDISIIQRKEVVTESKIPEEVEDTHSPYSILRTFKL